MAVLRIVLERRDVEVNDYAVGVFGSPVLRIASAVSALMVALIVANPAQAAELLSLTQTRTFSVRDIASGNLKDYKTSADTVQDFDSFLFRFITRNSSTIAFEGFDAALGKLTSVHIDWLSSAKVFGGYSAATSTSQPGIVAGEVKGDIGLRINGSLLNEREVDLNRGGSFFYCGAPAYSACLDTGVRDNIAFSGHEDFAPLSAFQSGAVLIDLFTEHALSGRAYYRGAPIPTSTGTSEISWRGDVRLTYVYEALPPSPGGLVPEPAAWLLMLTGFVLCGAAIRSGGRVAPRRG